jgi:hypothetical protein
MLPERSLVVSRARHGEDRRVKKTALLRRRCKILDKKRPIEWAGFAGSIALLLPRRELLRVFLGSQNYRGGL